MLRTKILVVDDEPHIRSLLRNLLSRQGYQIIEAGDGAEALSLCKREAKFDLLLTDVVMPGMDGLQLAERVREIYPAVRVLYMSGKCDIESVRARLRRGRFGFVRKPFEIRELGATVRKFAARRGGESLPAGAGTGRRRVKRAEGPA
jgi:DNA-binding NtrC family response regulator